MTSHLSQTTPQADSLAAAPCSEVKSRASRYGLVFPIAGAVTLGLLISMASLVATEFSPQDKSESVTFEINPVEDIVEPPIRDLKIIPLKQVEVPPPPPTLPADKADAVKLPIIKVAGTVPPFDPKRIDTGIGKKGLVQVDRDPTPIIRVPPVFPARFSQGDHSGYCRVAFDISADGKPYNVSAVMCTNSQLRAPSIKSVQKWNYTPKILDGLAVARSGLETKIRFNLVDERGRMLPLPTGA